MIEIPLIAIPVQSFTIQLDGSQYVINMYVMGSLTVFNSITGLNEPVANNVMAIDIIRNGTPIISGSRMVPGYPLIPYNYLEDGNFTMLTEDDAYPDYSQFGISQFLIYASQAEIAALPAGV